MGRTFLQEGDGKGGQDLPREVPSGPQGLIYTTGLQLAVRDRRLVWCRGLDPLSNRPREVGGDDSGTPLGGDVHNQPPCSEAVPGRGPHEQGVARPDSDNSWSGLLGRGGRCRMTSFWERFKRGELRGLAVAVALLSGVFGGLAPPSRSWGCRPPSIRLRGLTGA